MDINVLYDLQARAFNALKKCDNADAVSSLQEVTEHLSDAITFIDAANKLAVQTFRDNSPPKKGAKAANDN